MTDRDRYIAATHAMQTGVSLDSAHGARNLEPKHLRVGINTAHVDHAALVGILIDLGVFTHDQYVAALAEAMEREKAAYEDRLGVGL